MYDKRITMASYTRSRAYNNLGDRLFTSAWAHMLACNTLDDDTARVALTNPVVVFHLHNTIRRFYLKDIMERYPDVAQYWKIMRENIANDTTHHLTVEDFLMGLVSQSFIVGAASLGNYPLDVQDRYLQVLTASGCKSV